MGGDVTAEGGGGEARGWQGLSQEAHIVQETPAGGGTHTSSIILAVDSEIDGDVASNERRMRRGIGDFAMRRGVRVRESDGNYVVTGLEGGSDIAGVALAGALFLNWAQITF